MMMMMDDNVSHTWKHSNFYFSFTKVLQIHRYIGNVLYWVNNKYNKLNYITTTTTTTTTTTMMVMIIIWTTTTTTSLKPVKKYGIVYGNFFFILFCFILKVQHGTRQSFFFTSENKVSQSSHNNSNNYNNNQVNSQL